MCSKRLMTAIECAARCDAEAEELARAAKYAARYGRLDALLEVEVLLDAIQHAFSELSQVEQLLRGTLQEARGDSAPRAYAMPMVAADVYVASSDAADAADLGREVDAALERWFSTPDEESAPPRVARAGRC